MSLDNWLVTQKHATIRWCLTQQKKKITFGIFEFRIHINACVAHSTIQSIHNHGQFNCPQRAWHSTDKYGFPGIQWMRVVHHKIWVIQVPRPDLNLDFRREKIQCLLVFCLFAILFKGSWICQLSVEFWMVLQWLFPILAYDRPGMAALMLF